MQTKYITSRLQNISKDWRSHIDSNEGEVVTNL